jgi:predicted amidohydrolase
MARLKLAVVQFTPEFGRKQENLDRMQKLIEGVSADIFVFPEL